MMNHRRFILHLNVADFAVAVERVVDLSLRDKPVIVAPLQAARAAVYDMSEEAYRDGVRKGMLLTRATRICRTARVLPPRFDLYRKAMGSFVNEARGYSPVLEHGVEDGHLYLDITGTHRLFGTPPDVGWRLHRQIRSKLEIDPIWSLAGSKLVSKIGSRLVKPVGEYIVADGEEQGFLAPLPLHLLPGLSSGERQRVGQFNIGRIGELAALSRMQLEGVFGRRGEALFELSRGIDDSAVRPEEERPPRVVREHIFSDDCADRTVLKGVVGALAAQLGMELRATRRQARRVGLQLGYTDGTTVSRQASVRKGVADDDSLQRLALTALERSLTRRTRVRSCRLIGDRLHGRSPQLNLFDDTATDRKKEQLLAAMDRIRQRFGREAIRMGGHPVLH
jgi:DNA polymerase-4